VRRRALTLLLGCLLLIAPAAALDGYDYYQTIEYAATDVETYQQDIVIHRTTGTTYTETAGGLETWHIFIGPKCRPDYGDVRFTDRYGRELAYYLWPDYTSESAQIWVLLESADRPGALTVHYGNPAAMTTTLQEIVTNQNFEESGSWTYSEVKPGIGDGTDGTLPSTGWASHGSKSAYIYCGYGYSYSTGHFYAQYLQTVQLPAGQYVLIFDRNGTRITADHGYMAVVIDGTQRYFSRAQGDQLNQVSDPFTATGSGTTIALRNGVDVSGEVRYASGYWDYIRVHIYSAAPPAATTFSGEQETAGPPTTTFTASPTAGLAPLTVQFTDLSSGSPTSWLWDFGDGGTSTAQNPAHTYTAPGTHTITLTATNEYGSDYELKSDYITVYGPVTAAFTASPTSGTAPLTVQFTDTSTGGPTSWLWSFGDGGTSTAQNPQHTYTTEGAHTVTLTASHLYSSDTETKTDYITIAVLQPFPGLALIPRDLAGNGLYHDINANGRLDYNDLTIFFLNLEWARTAQPTECFDFNANSRIDYADVIDLFQVIKHA